MFVSNEKDKSLIWQIWKWQKLMSSEPSQSLGGSSELFRLVLSVIPLTTCEVLRPSV